MTPWADIKSSLPAEQVLGHYLGPSRHHTWHCPFHEDRTPSLSTHGPAIRCFGCQWAGDVFRFVETHLQVSRGEALRILADMVGIVLPDRTRQDGDGRRLRLPSLARSYAGVLRETAVIEKDIFYQTQKAAGLAWRRAWDARGSEHVWDAVELGAWLDREVELLRVSQ
ncbi:MAG: CHC2 zinc finger domain-containing protein [Acidobacteriota bacterium]